MNLFSNYPRASNIRFGSASEETNDFAFLLRRKSEIGFQVPFSLYSHWNQIPLSVNLNNKQQQEIQLRKVSLVCI